MCTLYIIRGRNGKYKEDVTQLKGMRKFWNNLTKVAEEKGYDKVAFEKILTRPGRLSNLPFKIIEYYGYRFDDMIISCIYGSSNKLCNKLDAVLYMHAEMYDCYILKLNKNEFQKSGPQHGLTLILYIGKNLLCRKQ